MIGIYKIENIVNDKVYIGQSVSIESRWYQHINALENNSHANKHLQNSWNKYGSESFVFVVLEECEENKLTEREQYWIDYYGGMNNSKNYNNRDAGNKGHLSEQTKEKLSEINLGKQAWNKGLTSDDERVRKYAESLSKRRLSDDMKNRIRQTVIQRHKDGVYNYAEANRKKMETRRRNGTVRKDKGVKRGSRDPEVGKHISDAKRKANERKRELGLPLRNDVKKPTPMKTSVCVVCGKEFTQRVCRYKKTCSDECRYKQMMIQRKENKGE